MVNFVFIAAAAGDFNGDVKYEGIHGSTLPGSVISGRRGDLQ
jgi:hypothetical protein